MAKKSKITRPRNVTFTKDDTFSLYWQLSFVIMEGLHTYKVHCPSPPAGFENLREWHDALDEMIWAFDNSEKTLEDFSDKAEWLEFKERRAEGMDLFAKHFRDLWW